MRVLIDIVHPAHVHFYKNLIGSLEAKANEVLVVSRERDVVIALLDELGVRHLPVSQAGSGRLNQLVELIKRVREIVRIGRSFVPDVILTRNPSGAIAGRLLQVPAVFDSDDGSAAGVHFLLGRIAASILTTPSCLNERYGDKHRAYPSYKALAYLHPSRFKPDRAVSRRLLQSSGYDEGSDYSIVRFVAFKAAHDRSEHGISMRDKRRIIGLLSGIGPVFISSEDPLPQDMADGVLRLRPGEFHDVLAGASIYVGDSQTVAAEAAVLGVPVVHVSSWSHRLPYLMDLEQYGLLHSFVPASMEEVLAAISQLREAPSGDTVDRLTALLETKIDLTGWYEELLEELLC